MVSAETIRTPLFVPANRPDRFEKAAASGTDAVILDLEDAVALDQKDKARAMLRSDFCDLPIVVRINGSGTPWHEADLAALRTLNLAAVMLPKSEHPDAVAAVCQTLEGHAPVMALIESGLGLAHAREIATIPGVCRLVFGSVDYCADLGCEHLREGLVPARCELVLASRLAAIAPPIDGVTVRLDDPTESFEDATHAKALGMTGKLCIHPRQIAEVRRAFHPSQAEIDWAHRVAASGDGAVSVDGAMIDEPVRKRARHILAQADPTQNTAPRPTNE
ncbi:CoA ester lyase [Vannielia sp.]|uniref:HpcH/HpaI aldolase/citrate lyase family protein n=1 Tax=Vannielia sp. TaxID=2813045 RepID=UPI00262F945C|nr:CoA ester lyase [Vannielia sp.]MDF1871630.1 CoA ester lyase [Vannielia sp.]